MFGLYNKEVYIGSISSNISLTLTQQHGRKKEQVKNAYYKSRVFFVGYWWTTLQNLFPQLFLSKGANVISVEEVKNSPRVPKELNILFQYFGRPFFLESKQPCAARRTCSPCWNGHVNTSTAAASFFTCWFMTWRIITWVLCGLHKSPWRYTQQHPRNSNEQLPHLTELARKNKLLRVAPLGGTFTWIQFNV